MKFRTLLLLLVVTRVQAQQPDPSLKYQTVTTQHFKITYTPELQHLVQPAANRAEEAYALLAKELVEAPDGRIDIVLTDVADISNGYATPLPTNRIVIFAKPPVDDQGLQHYRDWLDLVITHELAHIFHLDRGGRVSRGLRALFGRVPLSWPFFPALDMPRWNIEGLAVEFESRGTASGRQHGSFHEMIVRTAVLEDAFDPIDRVSGDTPIWPGPQRVYIYGSLFNDYIARKYGPQAQKEIAAKTSGSFLPPTLMANRIGKRALGESFTNVYRDWRNELTAKYRAQADSLRAAGLTQSERVTTAGRYALHPRISEDGTRLAYASEVGHDVARTTVIELPSGRVVWSKRRNGLGPADFAAGHTLFTTQYDFTDRYALRSDLVRVDANGEARVTDEARVQEVDVDRAGRIVGVELVPGSSRVVILDDRGSVVRHVTPIAYGVDWSLPRWSPQGDRIAVARWQQGGKYDVVVLDTTGRVVQQITDDEAVDAAPAWSPDGRYIVFSSDRTGITNLYAYDLQRSQLRQITNVLGGAFHPEITPDGRTLYFSAYHGDGYHLERMPFDASSWRAPAPVHLASAHRPRTSLDSAAVLTVPAEVSTPQSYSPWRTLRPHFWLPYGSSGEVIGEFIGAATAGFDLLQRHEYVLAYAREFSRKRDEGYLNYTYNGLRNPSLSLDLSRDWDSDSVSFRRDTLSPVARAATVEREDNATLAATFLQRRIRSSLALTLGAEVSRRRRMVVDSGLRFRDPTDFLIGPVARIGFANYLTPAYAISRENGVSLSVGGRMRIESDTVLLDRSYQELSTWNTAYRALGKAGFAHHVLAARVSAIRRSGGGLSLVELGGPSGSLFDFGGVATVGEGGNFLPVRGYEDETRLGSAGWSASLEYRLPLAMVGRGFKLWPVFLDRIYLSAFADAGNTSCNDDIRTRMSAASIARHCDRDPLASVGGELGTDVALLSFFTTRLRVGYGHPLTSGFKGRVFVSFGHAF